MVKRVQCEICGKRLLGRRFLKSHHKIVHREQLEET